MTNRYWFTKAALAFAAIIAVTSANADISMSDRDAFVRWTTQTAPYLHADPLYRAVQFSNLQEKQVFSNMLFAAFMGKISRKEFFEQAARRHPAFVYSIDKIASRLPQH